MSVPGTFDNSLTAWISQGFERLADRVQAAPLALHFDVLIIGSGYGGAIAAATFAGRELGGTPVTVGVLERGKEYLPGAFPKDMAELPRHIRRDGAKEGLFDIRLGPEVTTVVANGLGGGSLINAGVMEEPAATVFQKGWPAALSSLPTWVAHFGRARELLGSSHSGTPNTILNHPDGIPPKHQSIHAIAPSGTFRAAAITVAMNDTTSSGNVKLKKCLRCGDCATGCNFGAKNSLDVNLLVSAHQKGAEIFTGATVLSVEREMSGTWIVNSVPTNAALRARGGGPVRIRATKVVLAAGTLGSTEILLRSKSPALQFSGKLGQRCSTNGDMLITDYDTGGVVHTVADEAVRPSDRGIGPTITGIVDLRTTAGLVIEEMSVPAGLRRAFTEIFATTNALHSLAERDSSKHAQGFPNDDIYAVPAARIERSALYAVMGDDGAAGTIELVGDTADPRRDGVARIRWNKVQDLPVFDHQVATLSGLTQSSGGRVIPNPVWKLLPAEMTWLLKDQRGPLTTVHPLGGCAMADSGVDGAVDQHGRVFSSSSSSAVHDGLVVLDGSIIPTALGTNPSLTIAAVALRAAEALAGMWSYAAPGGGGVVAPPLDRPVFRETNVAATPQPTEVEIIERLVGPVTFRAANGVTATRVVELTLRFDPKALAALAKPPSDGGNPVLHVATSQSETMVRSKIRIYDAVLWEQIEKQYAPARRTEQKLDAIVLFSAPVSGSLRIFERQKTRALGRTLRAGWAWIRNRGLRDFWQAFGDDGPGWGSRIKSGVALASRSGEIRAFQYDLTIGTPDTGTTLTLSGHRILGSKRLTYNHRGNPWRQLMEVRLDQFPGLTAQSSERVLKLDVRYLARIGVPLLRIAKQGDGATAIGELASFFGYVVRLVLGLHIWSFRGPDKDTDPANDVVNPLPGINLPGLPPAQLYNLAVAAEAPEGGGPAIPGNVLLTRYPNPGSTKRPILMLHGYSASGTTFAHHAVNPNFASHFWSKGRDVWIADLRTSSGQPTATAHWSFDQIGKTDVPLALNKVFAETGKEIDVIAHCMGTVVFS
ncbi:MAG TPA: GMC oxidoreductase, partial [Gammaproteobacteria bacterium]|nr:GMC oxidoreductase [Gammaproteobacteria bacterium]